MSDSLWSHDLRMPGLPGHHQFQKSTQTHVHWVGDAIQPSHPLSFPSPPALNLSQHQGLFKWVSSSHQVENYQSFSFNISLTNDHLGLISFRMDWLDLLAVQGTQESSPTPQFKSINSLALSFLYSPTLISIHDHWKTIAMTRWTFVDKGMSLPFNMLSRLVITFLPRSKHLLISWLQSPSAGILEPRKIKSVTVSTVSPSIGHEVMGLDAMIFVFWMLSFKPSFSLSSFSFIKRLFSSSSLSAIGWCHLHIWDFWYFSRQSWFQHVPLQAQRLSWCALHIS